MQQQVPALGEFEQIVLLAILRLGENAYGVTIREEIQARTDRSRLRCALYHARPARRKRLSRIASGRSDAGARGPGQTFFAVTATGVEAVARAQRSFQRLLKGLKLPGVVNA